MPPVYDLIVVGGGILGVGYAHTAVQRGLKTLLVERDPQPREASVRNFGQIVPSGMTPPWQRLGRRSLEIYRDFQRWGRLPIRQEGSLYVASDELERTLLEELAELNAAEGYASELMTIEACRARLPHLRPSYCRGGLLFADELVVDARQCVPGMLEVLVRRGLNYQSRVGIQRIDRRASSYVLVDTEGRSFSAHRVVVCPGADFQTLFPDFLAAADLQVCQLQMLELEPQTRGCVPGALLTGRTIRRYEAFQALPSFAQARAQHDPESFAARWGVHLLFKQNEDGSLIVGDSHQYADESGLLDFDRLEEVDEFMLAEARQILDLPDWTVRRRWLGRYAQCTSRDVYCHRLDDALWVVTGIGGKGMTAGLGFAEAHLDTVLGQRDFAFASRGNYDNAQAA